MDRCDRGTYGGVALIMVGAVGSIRRLSWRDRREVLVIVLVCAIVEVGIRVMRLPTLATRLGVPLDTSPGSRRRMTTAPPPWALRRLELARGVVRSWPGGNTCLRRSLVMGNRVRSLHPHLRVGVAKDGAVLSAHAWLEFDGWYFDPAATDYEIVESIPP